MGFFKKKNKEEKEQDNLKDITYENFPFLDRARPKERYVFHSDYFDIDGGCGTIMTFIHREGANDGFPAFWGVNMIPGGLDADITTILFEQTLGLLRTKVGQSVLLSPMGVSKKKAELK